MPQTHSQEMLLKGNRCDFFHNFLLFERSVICNNILLSTFFTNWLRISAKVKDMVYSVVQEKNSIRTAMYITHARPNVTQNFTVHLLADQSFCSLV